ncbi:hypothetical protein V1512DRAFT_263707 [Lipomyces arxii]|uniref:uncharacterized protein n=1 Tax=Lipomyces arxii TaxID=56418 RepID=UPI0034CE109C
MRFRDGAVIIGTIVICPILYCVYFDYRRRHYPPFRRVLRRALRDQKRNEERQKMERYNRLLDEHLAKLPSKIVGSDVNTIVLASLNDADQKMREGRFEDSALSLYAAIRPYSDPDELLASLNPGKEVQEILDYLIKLRPFQTVA